MVETIKTPISNVTINYDDRTKNKMEYWAMVGWADNTWYSVLYTPPTRNGKIRMRNKLIELSADLLTAIDKQKE
jgi:hypothetical protein